MKGRRVISIALLAGFLSACDSNDDGADIVLDGDYSFTAPTTVRFDNTGAECGDGSGTLTVTNGVITGSAVSTSGVTFELSGDVTPAGEVTGGFAVSGENAASFEGSFNGATGSGTWEDRFQCLGTWDATKNE